MPFRSERQRRWMHANKPKMAARWEREAKSSSKGETMPRLQGRMKRISAKNPTMGEGAVKRLAAKRAASYSSRVGSQKSNATRTSNLGPNQAIGRGKKGTLKRALWKAGGTRSELAALRVQPKSVRKQIKKSARTKPNYNLRGTATNMKSTRAYDALVKKAAGWN